ncbi:MAG TPA: IS4 family transposase [Jiangellales bacterium]|nr:IS4 family transposase [Jiangellales bacterium]
MASEHRLADAVSLGVLTSSVPRDVVDEAIVVTGRGARRSDGKLPPHVMVYFTMGLALFADEDYEEVAARLAGTLDWWGCWDSAWEPPTSGGLTQARQRLGYEPLKAVFEQVARPVAEPLTPGAFLGGWRLMAIDGFEWDVPDTAANAGAFGYAAGSEGRSAFPKVRVVSLSECGSHAMVAAEISGRAGTGEQALARRLYPRLEPDWLVIADRNFYSFTDWQRAAATGAQLLWRVKRSRRLPVLGRFADGSFASILITPQARPDRGRRYQRILDAARAGRELDPDEAMLVRVIEYEVPHDTPGAGAGDPIRLITTIVDPAQASAGQLAQAYHERWEHETGNGQIKTYLRGPGRVLRSKSPDLVRAEIYGYLLTHYAISALICQAATEAGIDPDRIKFTRTVRIVRRSLADPAAFPP